MAVGRVHGGPERRSGSNVVITTDPSEADVLAALAQVPDPEIPVLSVIDLGIIHRVAIDQERIDVAILPTFVGCPALDVIRASIADDLGKRFGRRSASRRPSRSRGRRTGSRPPAASRSRLPASRAKRPGRRSRPHCSSGYVVMAARSARPSAGPCSTAELPSTVRGVEVGVTIVGS